MAIFSKKLFGKLGASIAIPISLLTTLPASASDDGPPNYTVEQLMEATGTNRSLAYFAEQVEPELVDQLTSLELLDPAEIDIPQLKQAMSDQLAIVFSADRLTDHVELDLEEKLSQNDIDSVTGFYQSELGKRIESIYSLNSTVQKQDELYEKVMALDTTTLDENWLALAKSIMTSTSTHELVTTLITESLVAPLVGMRDALPKEAAQAWSAKTNFSEFVNHVESMRPVIEQQALEFLTLTDYLVLADLNDSEYQQYAELFKSHAGRNYITVMVGSMRDFTKSALYNVGHVGVQKTL